MAECRYKAVLKSFDGVDEKSKGNKENKPQVLDHTPPEFQNCCSRIGEETDTTEESILQYEHQMEECNENDAVAENQAIYQKYADCMENNEDDTEFQFAASAVPTTEKVEDNLLSDVQKEYIFPKRILETIMEEEIVVEQECEESIVSSTSDVDLTNENIDLKRQIDGQTKSLHVYKDRIQNLNDLLTSSNERYKKLKETNVKLIACLRQKDQEKRIINDDLQNSKMKLNESNNLSMTLQKELDNVKGQASLMLSELTLKRGVAEILNAQIIKINNEHSVEIKKLEATLEKLKKEHDSEMKKSTELREKLQQQCKASEEKNKMLETQKKPPIAKLSEESINPAAMQEFESIKIELKEVRAEKEKLLETTKTKEDQIKDLNNKTYCLKLEKDKLQMETELLKYKLKDQKTLMMKYKKFPKY